MAISSNSNTADQDGTCAVSSSGGKSSDGVQRDWGAAHVVVAEAYL